MEATLALKQSDYDYDYVEWTGRARVVAPPVITPKVEIDTARISLATNRELRYWTDEFRATIYEIRDAIAAAGSRCPNAVRNYLDRSVGEEGPESSL